MSLPMFRPLMLAAVLTLAAAPAALAQNAAEGPSDAAIAHIAYTAGAIDVAAGEQALARSSDPDVRAFAQTMVRDHRAVNEQALALVQQLGVTPEENATSAALTTSANASLAERAVLEGEAFDRAYLENEVAFHHTVNGALEGLLIPSADNAELKALLETGLSLFRAHESHARMVAGEAGGGQ